MAANNKAAQKQEGSSYLQLLQKSNEQKKSEELLYVVEAKKLQLQADLLNTKQSLARTQQERLAMASSEGLDFGALSSLDDKIEGLEAGIKRLESYMGMFD